MVKLTISKVDPITVYPNPVIDRTMIVQFTDMLKGIYTVRLINTIGQTVMIRQLSHSGGNASHIVTLDKNIFNGTYRLEIAIPGYKMDTRGLVITGQ